MPAGAAKRLIFAAIVPRFLCWRMERRMSALNIFAKWVIFVTGAYGITTRKETITTRKQEDKCKKPYERPRLRTIPLVAEEVLAVTCKAAPGSPGKNGNVCGVQPCSVPGVYGS